MFMYGGKGYKYRLTSFNINENRIKRLDKIIILKKRKVKLLKLIFLIR
jgi:hypothetical protein